MNTATYKINNFDEAERVLANFVPAARKFREAVLSLENMKHLMNMLGNPQNKLKVVHVAGSSGKTSTSYYIASLLKAAGKSVGLTVSPHIDSVSERVQINLKPLSENTFCKQLNIFLNKLHKLEFRPTYFELLIAFSYWQFARARVDYAVVEVGLGGLLDATNVVNRSDKVCVITDIGFDHTDLLGKTLPEIASQKAGIIGPHNTVFSYDQGGEVMEVLREVCDQQGAELHEVWPLKPGELPKSMPLFQRRNWYLALMVYDFLSNKNNLTALDETQLATSTQVHIPARMEIVKIKDKNLVMDGAHNAQKMAALVASMKRMYPGEPVGILFSLVQSKKDRSIATIKELIPLADHLILTTFETQQDARKLSLNVLKMAAYCDELGFDKWEVEPSPKKALSKLLKRPEKILLVTGSFYLLNHIRPLIWKYDTTYRRH